MWDEVLAEEGRNLIAKKKLSIPEYTVHKKRIAYAIRRLLVHLRLNRATLNIGEKRHLETTLAALNTAKRQVAERCANTPVRGLGIRPRAPRQSRPEFTSDRLECYDLESAFRGRVRTFMIMNKSHKFPRPFLADATLMIMKRITNSLKTRAHSMKVNLVFCGEFVLKEEDEVGELKYFSTPNTVLTCGSDVKESLEELFNVILAKVNISKRSVTFSNFFFNCSRLKNLRHWGVGGS